MMSRMWAKLGLAIVLMAGMTFQAQAGFLQSNLVSGPNNTFVDQSREHLVQASPPPGGPISNGDGFYGIIEIENRTTPLPGASLNQHVYVVFSTELANLTKVADSATTFHYTFNLIAPTSGTVPTLSALTGIGGLPAGSVYAVFDSTPALQDLTLGPPPTGNTTQKYIDYITTNATLELAGGYSGAAGANDFITGSTVTTDAAHDFIANPALLPGIDSSNQIGSFFGGLSILVNNLSGVTFNKSISGNDGNLHQLGLSGGNLFGIGGQNPTGGDFSVSDKANFIVNVNVVPEPSSMILLGMGVASLAGYGLRRKSKESK